MAVTQYIGPRIAPVFADPVEWSSTKQYEPLTIVTYQGNSFTSRQFVPVGIDIDNTDFWVETGNYNAQVEAYRQETLGFVNSIQHKAFAFENVSEMQNSTQLYVGAICHTNGFHESGDGGAAWYVVSDSGEANGMDVISCNTFIAQLITPTDIAECYGFHSNNSENNNIIRHIANKSKTIRITRPTTIDTTLIFDFNDVTFIADEEIIYTGVNFALEIYGSGNTYKINKVIGNGSNNCVIFGTQDDFTNSEFSFSSIRNFEIGIAFYSKSHHAHYNRFYGGYLEASKYGMDINIDTPTIDPAWFNSNAFYDITFIGQSEYAARLICTSDVINENTFVNFSTENTIKGFLLQNANNNTFRGFRGLDYNVNREVFILEGTTHSNVIFADSFIFASNVVNRCTLPDAQNVLKGNIALSSAAIIFNELSYSKPCPDSQIPYTVIKLAHGKQKGVGLWFSSDMTWNPIQNDGYVYDKVYVASNGHTITMDKSYFNGMGFNKIDFICASGNNFEFTISYNDHNYTFTCPTTILFLTNNANTDFNLIEGS